MNQGKDSYKPKLEIILQIFPDTLYRENQPEISTYCPNCEHHKRKLIINLEKDLFHCWVCNYGGHISKLIRSYGGDAIWLAWQNVTGQIEFDFDLREYLSNITNSVKIQEKKNVSLPVEAKRLEFGIPSLIAKKSLDFLFKRGLSYKTIKTYNFYYCEEGKYRDRVILPSYDINGKLNFFIARSIYDSSDISKYIHPQTPKEDIIFNELMITWEKPVTLVEGPFDALAINNNAVPLLGSSLNEKSALLNKIVKNNVEVTLMLDNDKAGKEGTIKTGKLLDSFGIRTYIVNYSQKDPGEMTKADIKAAIKNRKVFTQEDIMRRILE